MYFVKYGNEYLHDPRTDDYVLLDLTLDSGENSCGFCDFTIYPTHPMYDKIKERDPDNPIEVFDGETSLFSGFIYELGTEFYLEGKVRCKGELDYLNDSIVRPYSTYRYGHRTKAPETGSEYFKWLIEQHNAQVSSNKQFVVGINQADKPFADKILYHENNSYPKTMDELNEVFLNNETVGGYIRIRHQNGIRYIDYLYEWTDSNTQILDFGVNLTDYAQTDDSVEIATFIVPIGARMSETEYYYDDGFYQTSDTSVDPDKIYYTLDDGYFMSHEDLVSFESGVEYYEYFEDYDQSEQLLTITDAVDASYDTERYIKSGDIIYSEAAVRKYGWIGTKYENPEITTREELISEAIKALKEVVSPKRRIEIRAVDMHLINPDIKPIRVGEYVRVRSAFHKVDGYFLCTSIELDLNNPENSLYVLGTTFDTLTGQQNKQINALNSTINKQFDISNSLSKDAIEHAQSAARTAEDAVRLSQLQDDAICELFEAMLKFGSLLDISTAVLSRAVLGNMKLGG